MHCHNEKYPLAGKCKIKGWKFSDCHKLWVLPRFLLCSEFLSQHSIITGFPMCKTLYTRSLFRILPYTLYDSNTLQRRNVLDLNQSLKPYATSFTPYEYEQRIQPNSWSSHW